MPKPKEVPDKKPDPNPNPTQVPGSRLQKQKITDLLELEMPKQLDPYNIEHDS